MTKENNKGTASVVIQLEDGTARHMGDGLFAIDQRDEDTGANQRIVVGEGDLRRLLASF